MKKQDVLRHLDEVVEKDISTVREQSDELVAASANLPCSRAVLEAIITGGNGALVSEHSAPRPSLRLLMAGYGDFEKAPTPEVARFVQERLFPLVGLEELTEPLSADAGSLRYGVGCDEAEDRFYSSASQLASGHYVGHRKISTYCDADGRPLLYRKSFAESTALSLVPLSIYDMYIPPGTIVAVDPSMDVASSGYRARPYHEIEAYTVRDRLALNPVRLSAWAFDDPLDRSLFACEGNPTPYQYDAAKGYMLEAVALSNFASASRRITELRDLNGAG